MFVGDAAGLTHPITGAGIAAAIVSGESAGQAAARFLLSSDADALSEFEAEMRDQFEASLTRAAARRQWLNQQWHTAASGEGAVATVPIAGNSMATVAVAEPNKIA